MHNIFKISRISFIIILLSIITLKVNFVQATDQDTSYVQILSDIPLAPNLSLEEDSDVVFDVPEGKIVKVIAFGQADLLETQKFYKESLEALGWHPISGKKWSYERDDESLEISFDDGENDLQVRFRLISSANRKTKH